MFLLLHQPETKKQLSKVNSLQETCAKCFALHLLKFEILQASCKTQNAKSIGGKLKIKDLMFFASFFHVNFKI